MGVISILYISSLRMLCLRRHILSILRLKPAKLNNFSLQLKRVIQTNMYGNLTPTDSSQVATIFILLFLCQSFSNLWLKNKSILSSDLKLYNNLPYLFPIFIHIPNIQSPILWYTYNLCF